MSDQDRKARLIDLSPSRKEIELEIGSDEVEKEYAKVLGDYAARVKLPGFRKGHAPRDMVRNLFDHDILHDVYDEIIPRALDAELKARGLVPVNVPEIQGLKHEHGQPLSCTVTFEVLPEFELPDYRSIQVPKQPVTVDDAEVEKTLEELRAKAAEYVPVTGRGVAEGDYVVAEIQGRELRTKRLLPVEKAVVLAGHADNEAALNEALRGQAAGETRPFRVSYPKDHANKRVAGKDIEYTLKVAEIKEKKVPPLGDEFAKSVGNYADLKDLREKVRQELREARERAGRNATATAVLREIAKTVSLELPESVVEQETLSVLRKMLSSARQGRVPAEALEGLKVQARAQAVEHLRNHLILEKIARKEGFQVTEEEVQGEIRALAQANGVSEKALAEMVARENRRPEIEENLLFRKTVDFLVKSAIIN
ncbi:MAG TPA: trigger factor [Burkholderiales bacterium]|nr:trigger factor [Burkholderiales bacterium]